MDFNIIYVLSIYLMRCLWIKKIKIYRFFLRSGFLIYHIYYYYRDEGNWSGGSGFKVTVLVFRDGERVNMLRVKENQDGTYSPIDSSNLNNKCELPSF